MSKPVRVLFVCLGNICRSPMAEAVFRHLVREAGLEERFEIDSAGLGGWHVGEPPHPGTRAKLEEKGIDQTGLRARQVRREELGTWDYIIAMDEENVAGLRRLGAPPDRVRLLLEFAPETGMREVPDPWYTGDFDETWRLVEAGCRGLLNYLRQQEGI
ncbi:MAG: low molecular weight phosphotyrosine protein phosphatase [Firmicutes bacterium]|nr:low molecular weight phosphotyrosine protein phosphatase [Bacillota bacterium]